MYVCMYHVCMYVRMFVSCMYVCTYVCIMYVCMYVCLYHVCMYVRMYVSCKLIDLCLLQCMVRMGVSVFICTVYTSACTGINLAADAHMSGSVYL